MIKSQIPTKLIEKIQKDYDELHYQCLRYRENTGFIKKEDQDLLYQLIEKRKEQEIEERDLFSDIEYDKALETMETLKDYLNIISEETKKEKELDSTYSLLKECFPKSEILYHMDPIEFVAHPRGNTYFILGNCETKLDIDCKVLEWFSRAAYKTEPYKTDYNNQVFHNYFLNGINKYFNTNFTEKDIEIIYTYLGNACHHQKTIDFIESGFDMSILEPEKEIER